MAGLYLILHNVTLQTNDLELQQVQVVVRHGARTPFKLIPNTEQANWPVEDNDDLPHTLINHTVRSLDFGGKPESAIDNAYKDKNRLKVSLKYYYNNFDHKYIMVLFLMWFDC